MAGGVKLMARGPDASCGDHAHPQFSEGGKTLRLVDQLPEFLLLHVSSGNLIVESTSLKLAKFEDPWYTASCLSGLEVELSPSSQEANVSAEQNSTRRQEGHPASKRSAPFSCPDSTPQGIMWSLKEVVVNAPMPVPGCVPHHTVIAVLRFVEWNYLAITGTTHPFLSGAEVRWQPGWGFACMDCGRDSGAALLHDWT
ncbi:hypothetical protein L345_03400, partial [Ophiophagus hannah]